MRNYEVYFELFGKKMKTTILAENEKQAQEKLKNKIIFHKIEKKNEEFNKSMDILDSFKDILNGNIK